MGSYFPNSWPLSYPNITKKYENIHKLLTAQKSTPKHKTIITTTEALPWNNHLYKIMGLNRS